MCIFLRMSLHVFTDCSDAHDCPSEGISDVSPSRLHYFVASVPFCPLSSYPSLTLSSFHSQDDEIHHIQTDKHVKMNRLGEEVKGRGKKETGDKTTDIWASKGKAKRLKRTKTEDVRREERVKRRMGQERQTFILTHGKQLLARKHVEVKSE